MATCTQSSSESRRRRVWYGSTRGTNPSRRRCCLLVATWSRFTNSELTGTYCSLQKSSSNSRHCSRSKVDEGDSLDPGDTVADPLLDARILSVQRNSAGDRQREFRNAVSELVQSPWAGRPVSGPRTFLWCCKFMSEHALHPLAHHSRFVQLTQLRKNMSCFVPQSNLG